VRVEAQKIVPCGVVARVAGASAAGIDARAAR
jgi:hypothetical protein